MSFIYDQNNQLVEVREEREIIAAYGYNGLGERVKKRVGEVATIYHYDLEGKLIAESMADGTIFKEYLYMGKVRIAMVEVGAEGDRLCHYLNDRLGSPEILTDAAGTVVWEAWYEPFGEAHVHPSSSVVNNHRFPGQYYDEETGLHYNYHRYYDPRTGRYLTPDPIGLEGAINPSLCPLCLCGEYVSVFMKMFTKALSVVEGNPEPRNLGYRISPPQSISRKRGQGRISIPSSVIRGRGSRVTRILRRG